MKKPSGAVVFHTYFKVFKKYLTMVILYTVILIVFAVVNLQTGDNVSSFSASKPDIFIVNKDAGSVLSENLTDYLGKNTNIAELENDTEAIDDALFYRAVSYIIYIPEHFEADLLNGAKPRIDVKSTGEYESFYAEQLLDKWLGAAQMYCETAGITVSDMAPAENADAEAVASAGDGAITAENAASAKKELALITEKIDRALEDKVEVKMTTTLDTDALGKATFYYNFVNYSMLAACVYVIAVVLSSFRQEPVRRRSDVSATGYRKRNASLLLANGVFAFGLWALYVLLSFILLGDVMCSAHGVCYILNSLVFTICALTLGFLIGNLTTNKGALSGIINVVALGSSFLCGSFVPIEWIPDWVLAVAHVLPSYWFIQNNEAIAHIEAFDFASIRPLLARGVVVIAFTVLFIVCTNLITRKKRIAIL